LAESDNFRLVFTARAAEDVKQLDGLTAKRIGKKIMELEIDPVGKSKKLVSPKLGTYRFRIGDYRVIFDIHGRNIVVLRIGHRREIYR